MTRDEYLAMLATEPATGAQVGAIVGEFARLGVVDRSERLAITAALLGLENVDSTAGLVMGDAGRLVAMLRRIHDRAELPDATAATASDDEDQGDEEAPGDQADDGQHGTERITWPQVIARIAVMIYMAGRGKDSAHKPEQE